MEGRHLLLRGRSPRPPREAPGREPALAPPLEGLFAARERAGELLEAHVQHPVRPVGRLDGGGLLGPRTRPPEGLVARRRRAHAPPRRERDGAVRSRAEPTEARVRRPSPRALHVAGERTTRAAV